MQIHHQSCHKIRSTDSGAGLFKCLTPRLVVLHVSQWQDRSSSVLSSQKLHSQSHATAGLSATYERQLPSSQTIRYDTVYILKHYLFP